MDYDDEQPEEDYYEEPAPRRTQQHASSSSSSSSRLAALNMLDFHITSTARVAVNVFDALPLIAEQNLPKGALVSAVSSTGQDPDYFVHVGTNDGFVILYRVTRKQTEKNTDFFEAQSEKKKAIAKGKKESIQQLEVFPESERLIVLTSGGVVQVMGATTLEVEETLNAKNKVDKIVTEKGSPLQGIACIQKRVVSIYRFRNNEYKLEKEVTLKDVPSEMEWTKGKLFIGYKNKYAFLHVETDAPEETDIEELTKGTPAINIVGEQLLLRHGRQGFFYTFTGKKTGKKLDWSAPPVAVGFRKPFALSLQDEQIEIHNCGDEQMVQHLKNSKALVRLSDSSLLIGASASVVFCLHPRSWESQMVQLMKAQRIDEAKELLRQSLPPGTSQAEKDRLLRIVGKAAGIVLFSNLKFNLATPYLKDSDVDVFEIISLFPGYLPAWFKFNPRHGLESIQYLIVETLTKRTNNAPADSVARYEQSAREAVLEILLYRRQAEGPVRGNTSSEAFKLRRVLDTAIIKLLVDLQSPQLNEFLNTPAPMNQVADKEDVVAYLKETNQYNALALFFGASGDYTQALDVWREQGQSGQEYDDGSIPGVKETVDLLGRISDTKIIFKYSVWVIDLDPNSAAGIFASTSRKDPLNAEEVLGFLQPKKNGLAVAARFLEFIIYQQNSNEEKYHNKLASIYIDTILQLLPQGGREARGEVAADRTDPLSVARMNLLKLMEVSKVFNAGAILLRIKDAPLYDEQILCHTKLGNYEEALNILYLNLKRPKKAIAYCAKYQSEVQGDTNLFLTLLKVQIKGLKGGEMNSYVEALLNEYPQYLKPDDVIPLLPPHIEVRQLTRYLEQSLRHNESNLRNGQVERQIRKANAISEQIQLAKITSRHQMIDSSTKCGVCKIGIGDAMFVWYPNGIICHFKCRKSDSVCPVTGRDFKKNPWDYEKSDKRK